MTENATHLTLEGIRAQIDETLDALVSERSEEAIQKLQALVLLECRMEDGPDPSIEINWL
jgi:hypothetical protein